jgi:hypothetical protein
MEEFGTQLLALEEPAPAPTRRSRTRIAIAATATVAAGLVIALVAITGSGHPPTGAARQAQPPGVSAGTMEQGVPNATIVNRAAAAAQSAGSLRYHATTRVVVVGRPTASLTALGAVSFKHRSYQTTITNPAGRTAVERISTDGTLYARAQFDGRAPSRWVAIARPTKDLSESVVLPGSDALTDPPALLQAMATAPGAPLSAGTATVDGAATTAYHVTTQLAKVIPNSPLPAPDAREPVALTVWIDHAGLPLRVTATFAGPSGNATLTTQMHFYSFGMLVRVRAPKAGVLRAPTSASLPDPLPARVSSLFLPGTAP